MTDHANTETKKCPYCAEEIHADAIKCKYCKEMLDKGAGGIQMAADKGKDTLEGFWYLAVWGALLVPYIGGWIIVVLSSVLYYLWKKSFPVKARTINRHGWAAFLLSNIFWFGVYGGFGGQSSDNVSSELQPSVSSQASLSSPVSKTKNVQVIDPMERDPELKQLVDEWNGSVGEQHRYPFLYPLSDYLEERSDVPQTVIASITDFCEEVERDGGDINMLRCLRGVRNTKSVKTRFGKLANDVRVSYWTDGERRWKADIERFVRDFSFLGTVGYSVEPPETVDGKVVNEVVREVRRFFEKNRRRKKLGEYLWSARVLSGIAPQNEEFQKLGAEAEQIERYWERLQPQREYSKMNGVGLRVSSANFRDRIRHNRPSHGRGFLRVCLGVRNETARTLHVNPHNFVVLEKSTQRAVSHHLASYAIERQLDAVNAPPGSSVSGCLVFEVTNRVQEYELNMRAGYGDGSIRKHFLLTRYADWYL